MSEMKAENPGRENRKSLSYKNIGPTIKDILDAQKGALKSEAGAIKKKTGLILAGIGVGVLLTGVGAKVGIDYVNRPPEISSTFNNNAEINNVIAGINAVPATQEEITSFLGATTPVLEEPQSGEKNASQIKIMIPFDPEGTTKASIKNEIINHNPGSPDFIAPTIDIAGNNTPFYVPLVEGAEKVSIKTSVDGNTINMVNFIYTLNNGQVIRLSLGFAPGNSIAPSEQLKQVPAYDWTKLGNTVRDRDSLPSQEFDLKKNNLIEIFRITGKASFGLVFGCNNVGGLTPTFSMRGLQSLYLSSKQ